MATEELFRADSYLKECSASVVSADERGIVLDRTVFYPTGGGQPGDTGTLILADGTAIVITDAIKGDGNDVIHVPAPGQSLPAPGTQVTAKIDWERRYKHMRMHSALHLLCAVVTGDVTGGQIGADKSRLDFNVPGEALDKDHINRELARLIGEDKPVEPRWIDDAELASRPELVRTMSVKPPSGQGRVRLLDIEGVDLQPCGGTHVARTSEIGAIEVAKIENKGRQNRRVNLRFAE
jgi:misacylated tRNA(Ala) deacylase